MAVRTSLLLLVVLYKRNILESETLVSLTGVAAPDFDLKVLVWDNSPAPQSSGDVAIAQKKIPSLIYHSCIENISLARVYNTVARQELFQFLVLLDQDSILPFNFFSELAAAKTAHPSIELFLPIVKSGGKIVSPGSLFVFKGKHWSRVRCGLLQSKNTLAISSGMVISKKYFDVYARPFDERLNLYGIDTKFMIDYASRRDFLFVLRCEMSHDTLLWSRPAADVMLGRFRNLRASWPIVFDNSFLAKHLSALYAIYISIKLAVRYRDFRFLWR